MRWRIDSLQGVGLLAAGTAGGLLLLFMVTAVAGRGGRVRITPGELARRGLGFPVPAVSARAMSDSFEDLRGTQRHHGVDILAARSSSVVAVDDGTVAHLGTSPAGGISVYQFDLTGRYCYYYAHLEGYAPGLAEGQALSRGQVIGYVGTTGNAPRGAPHLHFAIYELAAPKQWWGGRPVDPYPLLK